MGGNQNTEVKAKLDYVHNLLWKETCSFCVEVETSEPVEEPEEKDVNFVNGTGFQGYTQRAQ